MKILLPLLFVGLTTQAQTVEELLQGNYACYKVEEDQTTYYTNTTLFVALLGQFGSTSPSSFDLNSDGVVSTTDIILAIGGYGNTAYPPDLSEFTVNQDFGEGNTWLDYNGSDDTILFGWFHRTPFDENNPANYVGWEGIYTFVLDLVTTQGTRYYYYLVQ